MILNDYANENTCANLNDINHDNANANYNANFNANY